MSVLEALVREHQIFRDLSRHMEDCAIRSGKNTEADLQKTLAVLLPALRRHEEIETMIFGRASDETELEHRRIEALSGKLLRTIQGMQRMPLKEMRPLILEFAEKLRLHLENEERCVWPEFFRTFSRSLLHSIEKRTQSQVEDILNELSKHAEALHEITGDGP